ncbi:hypothetical protein [Vibrio campbellii]|uniref:hypothetical protein n=1 Tax=Vibrio campbellii TaxID=680 RepID=UPI000CD349DC|nr:hypothetical protein [Vibrio campbellii]AUW07452.1 hypothetical protein C1N51_27750 [Vibrio campbellii]
MIKITEYFEDFDSAMFHLKSQLNGVVNRGVDTNGNECFVWTGEVDIYYLASKIRSLLSSRDPITEQDKMRFANIGISTLSKPKVSKSGITYLQCNDIISKNIDEAQYKVKRYNQLGLHGDGWRIPTFREIQELDLVFGTWWCTDEHEEVNVYTLDREYGVAFDVETKAVVAIKFQDSKHINGTSNFEGGGYNYSPRVILVRN